LEAIVSAVTPVSDAVSPDKAAGIKTKAEAFVKLDRAVAASAKLAFGDSELPGIGTEVWRELLTSAADFSTKQAYPEKPFPVLEDGAHCVLCLQALDQPAKERLKRFWEFIQEDVSAKRNTAQTELNGLLLSLRKIPKALPREIGLLADSLMTLRPKLSEQLKEYYAAAELRAEALDDAVLSGSWASIPSEPASLLEDCRSAMEELDQQAIKFKDDAGASVVISVLQAEISELKARERLSKNLSLVVDHLNALKKSATATAAAAKITTKSISDKASDLHKKHVTEEFKKRIEAELKPIALTRVHAGVDKKTDKGKVVHKVTVDGASGGSPDAVFSEGERTAVALAWFLAELAASEENCGIILDDPLSSLDHRIREAVVTRLVAEAKKRQVIIFTHDLVLYRELLGEADRQGVLLKFQNVEALGAWAGIITGTAPWDAMKVKNRINVLEQTLKAAKDAETAADPVKYKSAFRDFYGYLRSTWERAVEELLFHRVIERLEPEVKTMSLTGVDVDAPAIEAVFKGMTRASGMISAHDHAVAKNTALPASGDMDNDLAELKKFVERQKTKIKESEEKLAHLKK
jgi:energy-coupling factor transporter ATP-binding protein EcfA2